MKQYKKGLLTGLAALMALSFVLTGCDKSRAIYASYYMTERESPPTAEEEEESTADQQSGSQAGGALDMAPGDPIETSGSVNGLNYLIEPASQSGDLAGSEPGFYLFQAAEDEYPYKVIIDAGEKNTGGYDIQITGIEYDGTEAVIIVEETTPAIDDAVTQAFTYPCCGVSFDTLPKSIRVVNTAGDEFPCFYIRLDETEIKDGWFAVIEDGAGEIVFKTYVYKTDDDKYEYINVTSTTVSYGAAEWNDVVSGSGAADTREDVILAAKEFGSCGFVMFADKGSTVFSIDEFLEGKVE
ncbi:MAG: protease complex subunit PrcB family protein [Clostridiales bacterium]|nr:protease complex subunit PrcB family protein [Clostridiales bacterium]